MGCSVQWRYGFNCGSTLSMSEGAGRLAAQVAMNTTLSPAISGLVVTFTMRCIGLNKLFASTPDRALM